MDKQQFKTLVEKYIAGMATEEEIRAIYQWYNSFDDTLIRLNDEETDLRNRLWNKIDPMAAINREQDEFILQKKSGSKRLWYAVAATILLAISITLLFLPYHHTGANQELSKAEKFKPVGNKAILTLSDGKTIILRGTTTTEVRDKNNELVAVNNKEELNYQTAASPKKSLAEETNTVTTPKGAQYKVILPDGTKVWLNAASSVTYPLAFAGKERKVTITGEAYFEVAKDAARPFRVLSDKQVVEVLGTHFNINAYTDEPYTSTTLLEGRVRLISGKNSVFLEPGQQAQQDNMHLVVGHATDLEEITAWKDGYFIFDHEHIESLMRKISRWYDVDVKFEGPVSKDWFGGSVSRDKSAADILKKLELTGQIHFKIEGRRVIVVP